MNDHTVSSHSIVKLRAVVSKAQPLLCDRIKVLELSDSDLVEHAASLLDYLSRTQVHIVHEHY